MSKQTRSDKHEARKTNWVERQREVQHAAQSICNGKWTFVNSTVVDAPNHYAVQQYRDPKGVLHTVTLTREGIVLTII